MCNYSLKNQFHINLNYNTKNKYLGVLSFFPIDFWIISQQSKNESHEASLKLSFKISSLVESTVVKACWK